MTETVEPQEKSLRDEFAIAAMNALLISDRAFSKYLVADAAKRSYEVADAMMVASGAIVEPSLPNNPTTETGQNGVNVKPLDWGYRPFSARQWAASSVAGDYFVGAVGEKAVWSRLLEPDRPCDTIEEAKAAAQADYEARIRSALA